MLLELLNSHGIQPFVYTFFDNDPLLHVYRRSPLNPAEIQFMDQRRESGMKEFHIDQPMPDGGHTMLLFAIVLKIEYLQPPITSELLTSVRYLPLPTYSEKTPAYSNYLPPV